MFMGTRRVPTKAFDAWMEAYGGTNNAWTSEDRTEYHEVGPSSALDLLLWLEADRLRDLGREMTLEKLNAQRDVVRNERRQTSENTPYGKVQLRLPELLYPPSHPYHHPVIGSHDDLEAATVSDVQSFFATYYDPANAAMVIAGDFDGERARNLVQRWFGSIPSRGAPIDVQASQVRDMPTTLTSVVRETIEDNVALAKVVIAWQSPKRFGDGDAELELLASALGDGKSSRLYQSLVYSNKLAQSVSAFQASGALGSQFVVEVLVRPGVSLDAIEAAVDEQLEAVRQVPLQSRELERVKNQFETAFVTRAEGIAERAALLSMYEAERGDPGFAARDLERYRAVTAEGIRRVASDVLLPKARVILRVVPKTGTPAATPRAKTTKAKSDVAHEGGVQ